jgi:hypothetical protein
MEGLFVNKIKVLIVSGLSCFSDGICDVIEKENSRSIDREGIDSLERIEFNKRNLNPSRA